MRCEKNERKDILTCNLIEDIHSPIATKLLVRKRYHSHFRSGVEQLIWSAVHDAARTILVPSSWVWKHSVEAHQFLMSILPCGQLMLPLHQRIVDHNFPSWRRINLNYQSTMGLHSKAFRYSHRSWSFLVVFPCFASCFVAIATYQSAVISLIKMFTVSKGTNRLSTTTTNYKSSVFRCWECQFIQAVSTRILCPLPLYDTNIKRRYKWLSIFKFIRSSCHSFLLWLNM